jgi:hypothetical protein
MYFFSPVQSLHLSRGERLLREFIDSPGPEVSILSGHWGNPPPLWIYICHFLNMFSWWKSLRDRFIDELRRFGIHERCGGGNSEPVRCKCEPLCFELYQRYFVGAYRNWQILSSMNVGKGTQRIALVDWPNWLDSSKKVSSQERTWSDLTESSTNQKGWSNKNSFYSLRHCTIESN